MKLATVLANSYFDPKKIFNVIEQKTSKYNPIPTRSQKIEASETT